MRNINTFSDDINYFKRIAKSKRVCKNCGHTAYNFKEDRIICSYCGKWIYKNDKIEFRYRMKEGLKK